MQQQIPSTRWRTLMTLFLFFFHSCVILGWTTPPNFSRRLKVECNNPKYAHASITSGRGGDERGGLDSLKDKNKNIEQNGKQQQQRKRRQRHRSSDDMIEFIHKEPASQSATVDNPTRGTPPHLDDLAPFVETIVRAADMRKADDIVAMRVSKLTTITSFIIIVSGNSRPQNQAIAAAVQDEVEDQYDGLRTKGNGVQEGTADSGWILLDYGDVIVHIMTPKSRLFYNLEGQWLDKGGEYMDLSAVLIPNSIIESSLTQMDSRFNVRDEADPFWS